MTAEGSANPANNGLQLRHFRQKPAQITHLELREFALVGFSMGDGEVARYLGKYGSKGVSKAVSISGVPPFLLNTPDNPEGSTAVSSRGSRKPSLLIATRSSRSFLKNFYNTDLLLNKRVSEQAVQASWNLAAGASATASLACVPTWHEDFRKDLNKIDVSALIIHGTQTRFCRSLARGSGLPS
jgi:non-heme chloroperoxidase